MTHNVKATKQTLVGDGDTFEFDGLTFRVQHVRDEDQREPWNEHDGHGIVSDWTSREKHAGELVLASDRSSKRYYDLAETLIIAKRDGWGLSDEEAKGKTKKQITLEAVMNDYRHLKAWCDDEWWWMGVVVELIDIDGEPVKNGHDSLWGIESNSDAAYLDQVARECADEIASRFTGKDEVCTRIRK